MRSSRNSRIWLGVERMIGNFGAGEVAHQQCDAVVLGLRARRERGRFFRRRCRAGSCRCPRAAPRPPRQALAGDEGVPLGKLGGAVDDRLRVEFGERVAASGRKTVEHVDQRRRARAASAPGFGNVGDEEGLAAGLGERCGDRLKAKAIGVGLDDGARIRR